MNKWLILNSHTLTIFSWHPQQTALPDFAYSTLKSKFFVPLFFFLDTCVIGVPIRDTRKNIIK